MNNREIYDKLLNCAKNEIESWSKADKLTEIEQQAKYMPVLSGIVQSALYLLPTDDYFRFKDQVRELGGYGI
jgi:hypothetical protein